MLFLFPRMFRPFAFVALMLLGAARAALAAPTIPDEYRIGGFAIGCQAWSFSHFTVFEAIEKTARVGGKVIEFYPGQKLSADQPTVTFDHNASDEVIDKVKAKL